MKIKRFVCATLFALVAMSAGIFADDTELYVVESSLRTGANPKVLIIFDNSGSMRTIEEDTPGSYDSSEIYEPISSAHAY